MTFRTLDPWHAKQDTSTTTAFTGSIVCGPIDHDFQEVTSGWRAGDWLYCRRCGTARSLLSEDDPSVAHTAPTEGD